MVSFITNLHLASPSLQGANSAHPLGDQFLLLMKGHPGTGKSTLAKEIARQLQVPIIDKDDARDPLTAFPTANPAGVDLNKLSYDIMWSYVRSQLKAGLSCVVDCPLARSTLFKRGKQLADDVGASVVVVDVVAKDEMVWRSWLGERAATDPEDKHHKPQTWEDLMALIRGYEGCYKWPGECRHLMAAYVEVDSTAAGPDGSFQLMASEVIQGLRATQQAQLL